MASSSSSSTSAPAFSSRYSYHVFLSFREDTRNNFVGHLYSALKQKGIRTYKDDKTLRQGETIGPALMKGIDESQIALVVFSDNYADSSWCLNELVYIMNHKETRGQIVIPVFYKVDPSEVRKQKGKFGEALTKAKHELKDTTKLESWRKALKDAGSISGFHYEDPATRDEAEFIKYIVEIVSQSMYPLTSRVNDNLVGIETRMQDLESKLQIGSGGVCMIGVWGVGGGGKTTLASSFYNKVARAFDGCCLVEDIREKSSKNGLESLQVKILSDVLKQDQVRVQGVNEGKHLIRDGLCRKKVLIVLDDVNKLNQLEALAGKHDWFGEGSLIIITTRDVHLLDAHQVDVIHEISLFKDDEAIQLFCRNAFRHHKPKEGYEQLSKEVVTYAGGLPLALTVIGCFLCDKDMKEWRSALARLKAIPEDEILEKLKISFDGLLPIEKELFLDIACFFRRKTKDEAVRTLDACGFYPDIGIKVLIEKALITVSEYGRFDMHDLVQEMGHHIVRGDHPNNPAKHSRVWKMEDVLNLSTMDATMELDMIKAIRFEHNWDVRLQNLPQIVAKMKNVRWIDWECDLASPLPTNFSPRELCCLKFDGISQKQLWEGNKHLPKLRMMELYGLRNLMMTPHFDGFPNLERFKLTKCWYLEEIHPSIGRLEHLAFLSIESCFALKMFPPITGLQKLEILTFSRCPKLFKRPENLGWRFVHIALRKLDLSYCDLGDEHIDSTVWELPNLQKLNLTANKFSRLNFSDLGVPKLKWLNISYCKRLVELTSLPSSITVVIADDCTSLETFGDVSNCKCLWKVSHRRGNKLGDGDILLHSMLQGNAIEDNIISVTIEHHNPEGFVGRLFRGETFTLHLPDDWYNDFCGILICIVTNMKYPHVNIIIKKEVDEEDSRFEVLEEESVEPEYDGATTSVGYVPFNSLSHTNLLSSSYKIISFCIKEEEKYHQSSLACETYVGAELLPRRTTVELLPRRTTVGDEAQSIDSSEFVKETKTFIIQHDSQSSINILWKPCNKSF